MADKCYQFVTQCNKLDCPERVEGVEHEHPVDLKSFELKAPEPPKVPELLFNGSIGIGFEGGVLTERVDFGEGFGPFGRYACVGHARVREDPMAAMLDKLEAELKGAQTDPKVDQRWLAAGAWALRYGPVLLKVARAAQRMVDEQSVTVSEPDAEGRRWLGCDFCTGSTQLMPVGSSDLLHDTDCPWALLERAFQAAEGGVGKEVPETKS